jgi:hypothetical protein
MVSNRTQHPHPLPATHCLYILYFDTGKGLGGGGGLDQREGLRSNYLQSWVKNTNMTEEYLHAVCKLL